MRAFLVLLIMCTGCTSIKYVPKETVKVVVCESNVHTSLSWNRDGGSCWFHARRNLTNCPDTSEEAMLAAGKKSCEMAGLTCEHVQVTSTSSCKDTSYVSGVCYFEFKD